MNVEELEVKIKEEKAKLVVLEEAYEKEENETKQTKLEFKISRKEEAINRLIDRQVALLDKENKEGEEDKSNKKDKNAEEEEDNDVCSVCGGDLVYVGKDNEGEVDIYECEQCGELYTED